MFAAPPPLFPQKLLISDRHKTFTFLGGLCYVSRDSFPSTFNSKISSLQLLPSWVYLLALFKSLSTSKLNISHFITVIYHVLAGPQSLGIVDSLNCSSYLTISLFEQYTNGKSFFPNFKDYTSVELTLCHINWKYSSHFKSV